MISSQSSVLCIHYYFPPLRSSAVIRNYHIADTLALLCQQVHVLTSDNHKVFPKEDRPLRANLSVHDVFTFDYKSVLGRRRRNDSHAATDDKNTSFTQLLLKVQKSFPFNLWLAEGNLLYIINAYLKAKRLIRNHKIDIIYSSFGPYADHYVAYLLKRRFPHLHWVADFRDLQVEPIYNNVVMKNLQVWMERKVLSKTNRLITISQGFANQLKVYHQDVKSIMRGVQLRKPQPQFDKFTISYTGSLYLNYRDPSLVFQVLRDCIDNGLVDVDDLDIVYAGRDGHQFLTLIEKYELSSIFTNEGMVSHELALRIQDKSHINLLLTSSSQELSGVMTGKVFEYFESGNSIICLITGVYDPEFEALFDRLNAGIVTYDPPLHQSALKDFILSKYNEYRANHSVLSTIDKTLLEDHYSWEYQVKSAFS